KSDAAFAAAGVAFYSTAFSSQALFARAFRGYRLRLSALPLAVSMGRIIERLITLARAKMQ
ncbi:hypothetical protein, partial [Aeromonas jandaei]|uniref:hypothetical protein n=1 Tax=Aeromonas jandaei TaxID=650 RepID=UPI003B9E03F5